MGLEDKSGNHSLTRYNLRCDGECYSIDEIKTTLIAEIGVNHNGSVAMAEEMIRIAAQAGVDVVKFQTFKAENVISCHAEKAAYQKETTGGDASQLDMVRPYELSESAHRHLFDVAQACGVEFLSTPFDVPSVDLLLSLSVRRLKVPSGEITNAPLLYRVAQTGLPVILSTGMSTLAEIETALGILALGAFPAVNPSLEVARNAYASPEGKAFLKEKVTLLHCTTQYPTPLCDVNLRCLDTLRDAFGLPVGFSDHTVGIEAALAAVARGAAVIEKHFTLDCHLPGPDHRASIEPDGLRQLVQGVRQVEAMLGSPEKRVVESERANVHVARKSLVARCAINKGEVFTEQNLTTKRPGNGVCALRYWEALGQEAKRDYAEDELIDA